MWFSSSSSWDQDETRINEESLEIDYCALMLDNPFLEGFFFFFGFHVNDLLYGKSFCL